MLMRRQSGLCSGTFDKPGITRSGDRDCVSGHYVQHVGEQEEGPRR